MPYKVANPSGLGFVLAHLWLLFVGREKDKCPSPRSHEVCRIHAGALEKTVPFMPLFILICHFKWLELISARLCSALEVPIEYRVSLAADCGIRALRLAVGV
jgi:hypothetical protein